MDEWMGRDMQPVTLNKYLYGGGDPINNIDPSGYFFDSASFNAAQGTKAELQTTAGISASFYYKALVIGVVSVSLPGDSLITNKRADGLNKVTIQLQKGSPEYWSQVLPGKPDTGVLKSQAYSALLKLFTNASSGVGMKKPFPRKQLKKLKSTIITASSWISSLTKGLIGESVNKFYFDENVPASQSFRIDINNKVGWNLRK